MEVVAAEEAVVLGVLLALGPQDLTAPTPERTDSRYGTNRSSLPAAVGLVGGSETTDP